MTGLQGLHSLTKDALCKCMGKLYLPNVFNPDALEDMVLATSERSKYADIGTDRIRLDTFCYLSDNILWINVCLFINSDFRDCFNDAIMIEKALLQVTRDEYNAFREDMTLASMANSLDENKNIYVSMDKYLPDADHAIQARVDNTVDMFYKAGMTEVYEELAQELSGEALEEVAFVVRNVLYFVNAMNRNGVFAKYVKIVIENVKKQLGAA